MAMTVVVAYDISEDRRRSRVAVTLQECGDRVQRSVFVCILDADQLTELLARVTDMIDTDTDSVYAFRQCAACWDTVGIVGQATVNDDPYYWAVL
jgi:CRISPR-associated protein Cas2